VFVARLPLALPQAAISKIVDKGTTDTKIDIVFVGSGFASSEMPRYVEQVQGNVDKMFSVDWFSDNTDKLNIWRVDLESSQSGVRENWDTLYKAASMVDYDIIVVLHNRHGQEGVKTYFDSKLNKWFEYAEIYQDSYRYVVLAHELGHIMGKLDDEYYGDGTLYKCDGLSKRTLNIHDKPSNEKWQDLVIGPPYEGARFCKNGLFRSTENSIMKDSAHGKIFGPVGYKAMDLGAGKILGYIEVHPPFLKINGINDGDKINGSIKAEAIATDASGVERVEFYWAKNGKTSKSIKIDRDLPYSVQVDTTEFENGNYYLDTIAYDRNWNYTRLTRNFDITNETKLMDFSIPLNLRDVSGYDRAKEPVSSGVPFPQGILFDPKGLAVFDADGLSIPAQFKVLERWRDFGQDKSIKWLLVIFSADVKANSQNTYYLRKGDNPLPLRSAMPSEIDSFLNDIDLVLTRPDGSKCHKEDLEIVRTIEESGPIRSCVKLEAKTDHSRYGFIAWVYKYAAIDRWDMTFVLKNTPIEPQGPFYFKDFSIIWKQPGSEFVFGEDGGENIKGSLTRKDEIYLYQDSSGTDSWRKLAEGTKENGRGAYILNWTDKWQNGIPNFKGYKIYKNDLEIQNKDKAPGWATLGKSSVAVRHFWQQFPKAIKLGQNKIAVKLWPEYWKGHGGLHWLDDLQRKAHDISFVKESIDKDYVRKFNHPLIIHCGLDWYRKTDVLGYISNKYSEKEPNPDNSGLWEYNWVMFGGDRLDRIRRKYHDYPMDDFIKSGDPYHAYKVFLGMRHSSGMTPLWLDEYKFPEHKGVLKPKTYTTNARDAGLYSEDSDHHGYKPWNQEHWRNQEIYDGWRLFGDPLAYDAAKKTGVYLQHWVEYRKENSIGETRIDALPQNALCEAYRVTGDETFLDSLETYLDIMWKTINKERGYYVPNVSVHPPDGSEKVFMLGYLGEGLLQSYQITGNDKALDMLIGITNYAMMEPVVRPCTAVLYNTPVNFDYLQQYKAGILEKRGGDCTWFYSDDGNLFNEQRIMSLASISYFLTGETIYKDLFFDFYNTGTNQRKASLFHSWNKYMDLIIEDVRHSPSTIPQIVDLSATNIGRGRVKLTWSTPSGASKYQIKYSQKVISERLNWPFQKETNINWWAADNVENEPIPGQTDEIGEYVLKGLNTGNHYFAIKSFDKHSNISRTSNVVTMMVGD
jgi:hypothetical protein